MCLQNATTSALAATVATARSDTSGSWVYDCVQVDDQGKFETTVEWESSLFETEPYLMISAADEACYSRQGWVRSVWNTVID